jgi:THO complex subunit 4
MSESRLDQSLESIISSRKQSTRKGRGGRRSDAGGRPAATAAPVGGVKKSTKQNKQPKAAAAAAAAAPSGESKIMISNLVCTVSIHPKTSANSLQPLDVEQNQLQVCKTLSGL